MNFIRLLLDWFGWERLSETNKRHQEILKAMATLAARLAAIETNVDTLAGSLTEGLGEVTTEIANLRDQLGTVTPEVEEIMVRLETKTTAAATTAKAIADIIPNAPPAPTP